VGETENHQRKADLSSRGQRQDRRVLKQHQGPAYPSEIADHYGLELEPVFEAVKQLIAEGKAKEAE